MNMYLFLYPIQEYFEKGIVGNAVRLLTQKGRDVKRLSDIINARYRAYGYQIWWLLFSASNETPHVPDHQRLASSYINANEHDTFFACGVTFADHIAHAKYPKPAFILDQLPQHITRLVLGGFHQWDCVDQLASAAYARGIPVMVDEDTTESFFYYTSLDGEIPLERPLAEHANRLVQISHSRCILTIAAEERQNKPWFSPLLQSSASSRPAAYTYS